MEYNIPYIHLRGLFARNYESSVKGKLVGEEESKLNSAAQRGSIMGDGNNQSMGAN